MPHDSVLEAKLHPPDVRPDWVQRGRLLDDLAGFAARLVLVAAPAGFGKTTLVAQWSLSRAETRPFAWLSLDSGDNDPVRLWRHAADALQRACPAFSADNVLALLRAQRPDFAGTLLPLLVNELAALPEPVVLVLDDYQVMTEPDCHDQVAFLLLHLPPAVQLVLITRADPPLPLARLRVTGEMVEIRAPQLRFTPAEADEMVATVAGVMLSETDLAELVDRTEGWPAGIYLAALTLRGRPSPGAVIRQFTGDSRFVVDFLTEEVLSRLPPRTRQFLARTSILSRFRAPLAEEVAGSADAAEIIGQLEQQNLFVVPLDDTRQWFRYHRLFGQMLRSELARTEPDLLPVLHQRASAWHRRSGSADEAIGHAHAAGDLTRVTELIAANWFAYADSGRVAAVRGWLALLGDDAISADPVAAHCAAWAAALSGDRESLECWLPVVKAGQHDEPLPDGMRSLRSSAVLLQGTFGFDGIGPMRDAAAEAVTLETNPASPWYTLARVSYATALYWSGDLDGAAAQSPHATSGTGAVLLVRMLSFAVLSLVALDRGDLTEAQRQARTAQEIMASAGSQVSEAPQSSLVATAVGAICAGNGRLAEARGEFEHALRNRRRHPGISPWPTLEILLRLAPVLLDLGDRHQAVALLAEARQLVVSYPVGAKAQRARLDHVEQQLTGTPRQVSPGAPLTEREAAVLRLLRGPLSLREIGQELYVSQNTVKTHTQAIYRKLGVSTRHDAIAMGRDIDVF